MATEKVEVYVLDVRVPKMDPKRVTVKGELSLGSDAGCDIRIQEFGLAPLQGRFRLQNEVLTFTNLGPDNSLKVGSQKCGHGRMYILDKGDKCIIDKVKLIVRKDKIEKEIEGSADLDDLNDNEDNISGMAEETHAGTISDEDTQDNISADETGEAQVPESSLKRVETDSGEEEYEIVEEVVYVDEDGNEVTKPKEPNFFSQFRDIVKKKENSKKKVQKASGAPTIKKGKKIRDPVAGPLYRFIGFAYNIGFFLLIYKLGLPALKDKAGVDVFKMVADLHTKVLPYLKKMPAKLPKEVVFTPEVAEYYDLLRAKVLSPQIFEYVTLYAGYEVIFNFILGIGLGYFLIGMNNGGHFIVSRVLAPLRVALNLITMPLLVFDFPVIFTKRSFKEIMTLSRYQRRSPFLTFMLAVFILPLLGILAANYPIYPALLEVKPTLTTEEFEFKKKKGGFKDQEFNLQSISLNLKDTKAFVPQRTSYVPSISATKKGIFPQLIASDFGKNNVVEIIRYQKVIPLEKIIEFIKRDPLLTLFHPEVAAALDSDAGDEATPTGKKNTKKAKGKDKEDKKLFLDSDLRKIIKIVYHSLALNIKDPLPSLQNLGIILSPYYELQNYLYSKLDTKRITRVELINGSKDSFVSLTNNDSLAHRYLLRANGDYVEVIDMSYNAKDRTFASNMVEKLFHHSTGYKGKYSKTINTAAKSGDIHVRSFAVLDIFNNVIEGKKINDAESKIVSDLFIAICARALKTESNEYQQTLLDNFEELDKILIKLKLRNKDSKLGDLRLNLIRTQEALYKRDEAFFKLNN